MKFSDNTNKSKDFDLTMMILHSVTPKYPRWPPFAYIRPWRPSWISRGHRVQYFQVEVKRHGFARIVWKFRHCAPNINRMAQLSIRHLDWGYAPGFSNIQHVYAFYISDGKLRHSINIWSTVTKFSDNPGKSKPFNLNLKLLHSVTPRYPRWPPSSYISKWRPSWIFRGHRVQNHWVVVKALGFSSTVWKFRHYAPKINRMAQLSVQHVKYGSHHGSGKNSILWHVRQKMPSFCQFWSENYVISTKIPTRPVTNCHIYTYHTWWPYTCS